MADRLQVTELDFDTIKNNLKAFLNQQSEFTDYDFEGSGLNILLDILAYNTHYNAYYLNMVANESFLDTAILRDSVISHAKTLGYTPHSTRASVATINFTANSATSTSGTLTLPAGFGFLSNQIDSKPYNFVVLEDTTVTKSNSTYYFENLEIYEGQLTTYRFTHNSASNPKQVFTLPDANIDTTTIKVQVASSSGNTQLTVYNSVSDILDVGVSSEVYYLQENKSGKYQIYFGNNVVGKSLPDGAIVNVTYLRTNGTAANKANNYVATSGISDSLAESITSFVIDPISSAAGGAVRESVDDIKFAAAAQFTTQNRLVTFKDYESYLKKNYPSIDSLSVWGGEDETPPSYGKVYIALKPKTNYFISETEKQRIIDEIIKPKAIVAVSAEIRDAKFLYLLVKNTVKYDKAKTVSSTNAITTAIRNAIINYSNTYLNKFNSTFILSKLQDNIDGVDLNAIAGSETILRLEKRFPLKLGQSTTYEVDYNALLHRGTSTNKLTSSQFTIFDTVGVLRTAQIEETPESFTGVSEIQVTNAGTGYTSEPTVTITGDGVGAIATAVLTNGKITNIVVTKRGINYTRALVSISGGGGYGASAIAILDGRFGTLRTFYYDENAEKKIINAEAGTINYTSGLITLNDLNVNSISTPDALMRINIESERGIITSSKDTIITIDVDDPTSITTELSEV
jgi:hypothetical protein